MNRARRWRGEGGYVLSLVAVALVPLVAVTAIAVDLAVWQARGAQLQRAADAAALAAVPGLASGDGVAARARAAAAANGVVHGVAGVRVEAQTESGGRVGVTVVDPSAPRVFSLPFLGAFDLQRRAVGEWVEPVSLGSPRNYLGTGSLAGNPDPYGGLPGVAADDREGYWLAVNGPCSSREQGDLLTAVSVGNVVSPNPPAGDRRWRGCTSAADPTITMLRPEGPATHQIGIRVPTGYRGGPFSVQVFDAAHCAASPLDFGGSRDPFETTFVLRDGPVPGIGPDESAVLGRADFTTGARCGTESTSLRGYACGPGSWAQRWCNLAAVSAPRPGALYVPEVSSGPVTASARHGANAYGVRIMSGPPVATGSFVPCSTDPLDGTWSVGSDTCVAVEGRAWLSVSTTGGGADASFSLAGIGPQYAGSTMEVALFDIGEGSESLQLLDPAGAAVGFSWEVEMAPGDVPPTGGTSGVVAPGGALDVGCTEGHPQRGPGRISGSKYNDRLLRLRVALPDDPVARWGQRQWWRVRYRRCADRLPTDRTTWAVWVEGQPVRLIG